MPEKTLAVANYFLERGAQEGIPIDHLKLQKLVYFAHGWHLAVMGTPLLDENVEAWQYGPVVPTIYHEFKSFGQTWITRQAVELVGSRFINPRVTDAATLSVLDRVWEEYKGHTGIVLSNISHEPGSPWERQWLVASKSGKIRGVDIPDKDIQEYFFDTGLRHRKSPRH